MSDRTPIRLKSQPRSEMYFLAPDDLTIIGLDTDDGPEHPMYDERINNSLDAQTMDDIRTHGILQNVRVCRDGDGYIVVDGRQRVRLAREINKVDKRDEETMIRVPVVIARADEIGLMRQAFAANEHRTADDPVTRALKMQRMLDRGAPMKAVAVTFRFRNVTEAKAALSVLDLSAAGSEALKAGRISYAAALELAKAPRKDQEAALNVLLGDGADAAPTPAAVEDENAEPSPVEAAPASRSGTGSPTAAQIRRVTQGKAAGTRGVDRRRLQRMLDDSAFATAIGDTAKAVITWLTTGDPEALPESIRDEVQAAFDRAGQIRQAKAPKAKGAGKGKTSKAKGAGKGKGKRKPKPTPEEKAEAAEKLARFKRGEPLNDSTAEAPTPEPTPEPPPADDGDDDLRRMGVIVETRD